MCFFFFLDLRSYQIVHFFKALQLSDDRKIKNRSKMKNLHSTRFATYEWEHICYLIDMNEFPAIDIDKSWAKRKRLLIDIQTRSRKITFDIH